MESFEERFFKATGISLGSIDPRDVLIDGQPMVRSVYRVTANAPELPSRH